MKNIHILPTDKWSRIRIGNNGNFVIGLSQNATVSKNDSYTNQNIYITSDEEIKEGDWFMSDFNSFPIHNIKELSEREGTLGWKQEDLKNNLKIILTTDQDLIKDGVQAIDDEFLEWFVENPSCEEVEIKSWIKTYEDGSSFDRIDYEIIIPKEETKKKHKVIIVGDGLPKQETLEEFIQRQLSLDKYQDQESAIKYSILAGAKWQQERMYSEEKIDKILQKLEEIKIMINVR